ncbi:hypothetical protein V9K67_13955 [Paraflavisolibacter sp. H34]|uniref:hypothetical protein n=1 Tax=Huijunlia imazamoxiresistens TaxID=3127457 RepID=UPI003019EA62
MTLKQLIQDLWDHGNLTVSREVTPFDPGDLHASAELLRRLYHQDFSEMPLTAPDFDGDAALWGAATLYRALQLLLLRDLDEPAIRHWLPAYAGPPTPEALYSADLSLRHLPEVLAACKGLAPGDPLVTRLQELALEWPFSATGLDLPGTPALEVLLDHPSLRSAYRDRVIGHRDTRRLAHPEVALLVAEALGRHPEAFWPGYPQVPDATFPIPN